MRTFHQLVAPLWLSVACALACSSPPASTVIVVQNPGAGGGSSEGGAPPISFQDPGGADNSGSGSGGAGATNAGSGGGSTVTASTGLPCDVATYFAQKCTMCHGEPPIPSALAPLVTIDDLKATAKEDPTKNEAELSLARMKDTTSPMPPGAPPSAADVAILEGWINAGYPAGTCGTGASGDGGVVAAPPPSVFDGAPPFQSNLGDRAHNAGQDCMSCHTNGSDEAPRFAFGGTLYDPQGNPVAGAEVRLVDANGNAKSVYTASNGTFFAQGGSFAGPAHVGVRTATDSEDMFTALQSPGGGACSSCHCSGTGCTVSAVHVP
ncbi:MAG TPA: carboxypeptidase-like regulatory domain-containing protein [Polyangiaceae bacterium]|nr:carboxypeptidase-like regulatory domain-containing protein [Polyangiaceae bacterium]